MLLNKILDTNMKFNNPNRVSLLCAGLLFANSFLVSCDSENNTNSDADNSTAELSINLDANLQTMESFGASDAWQCNFIGKNWPSDKRNKIADLLDEGVLKTTLKETYKGLSADNLKKAHQLLESGKTIGKIAIKL